jgi:hypothetical protein
LLRKLCITKKKKIFFVNCELGQKLEISIPIETTPDLPCLHENFFYQYCARKEYIRSFNSESDGKIGDTLVISCGCMEPLQEDIKLIGFVARKPIEEN